MFPPAKRFRNLNAKAVICGPTELSNRVSYTQAPSTQTVMVSFSLLHVVFFARNSRFRLIQLRVVARSFSFSSSSARSQHPKKHQSPMSLLLCSGCGNEIKDLSLDGKLNFWPILLVSFSVPLFLLMHVGLIDQIHFSHKQPLTL